MYAIPYETLLFYHGMAEQRGFNTVDTALGELTLATAEMSEVGTIEFYISVLEVSDTWEKVIEKAIEVGKLSNEEAKRYGWTWSNAGVTTITRLHVVIHSNWRVSTGLEVYYQDKENDYLFGTVYFDVDIPDDMKKIVIVPVDYRKSEVDETIL